MNIVSVSARRLQGAMTSYTQIWYNCDKIVFVRIDQQIK